MTAQKKCHNCNGRGWVALDMMGEDIKACEYCKTMETKHFPGIVRNGIVIVKDHLYAVEKRKVKP